mmetsp:Transcript_61908/g.156569  ORF Transcript_61908/g.156569 Transcript_61908/m.156569 type:complete len:651 (-) Transcript_61908:55-2007(-)
MFCIRVGLVPALVWSALLWSSATSESSCASNKRPCAHTEDGDVALLQRSISAQSNLGFSAEGEERKNTSMPKSGSRRRNIAGKSVYLIMTDRFSREGGFSSGDESACSGNNWCNGTLRGITAHLPYIKGMGFDCIWVTPPVKNFDGDDGQSGYGYAGYWAEDYYDIDPHFGSKADLKELVSETHKQHMCFILDIVLNHVRPIHSTSDMAKVHPFNETAYVHQLGIGSMTFDEYTDKKSGWPPPAQALSVGAACGVELYPNNTADWTNGGNYCNNFNPSSVYNKSTYLGDDAPGPYHIKYCGPGNFDCKGYNVTLNLEGWFYDLGDLNQSVPFVRENLKQWAAWMATEYNIDGIRLDTAPFMPYDFLEEVQEHLNKLQNPMEIIGEVTTTNISFHASFQQQHGRAVLAGMENFPLEYFAQAGYCGWPNAPSSPVAMNNLNFLARATKRQLESGLYSDPDLLMNFMDNQDDTPVAALYQNPPSGGDPFSPAKGTGGCIDDASRVRNSLTWVMLARGMPVITWGDEQGNTDYRNSLWQYKWNTTTWQYQFIKTLNSVRHEKSLRLTSAKVLFSSEDKFVFRRGLAFCPHSVWVYTNNMQASSHKMVKYPVAPHSRLPHGKKWFNALTDKPAVFSGKYLIAKGTEPQVLVARRR